MFLFSVFFFAVTVRNIYNTLYHDIYYISETPICIHGNIETETMLTLTRHKALWNFQFYSTLCSEHTSWHLLAEKQLFKPAEEILRVCFIIAFIPPSESHSQLRKAAMARLLLGQVTCSLSAWVKATQKLALPSPAIPHCADSSFYPLNAGVPPGLCFWPFSLITLSNLIYFHGFKLLRNPIP